LGDDQPRIFLVVRRDDVPRRMMSASRMQTLFVGAHVMLPVFPLVNVGGAELPVLVRLIDARQKPLSLLLVRKMQEYLDGQRAVAMKMLLQIAD